MPRKCISTDEQIKNAIKRGMKAQKIASFYHCSASRVGRLRKKIEAETGVRIVATKKMPPVYKKRKQNKIEISISSLMKGRSCKDGWIAYMKQNPVYFQGVFEMDPIDSNIIEVANNDTTISSCWGI